MFQKWASWWKRFSRAFVQSLPVTVIMSLLWLILGWASSFGVHSVLLSPLYFLTGALAGLDGGSFIGGTVGKTILLLLVNSFVRTLFLKKGDRNTRLKAALKAFGTALVRKLPQYFNIKQLFTGERWRLSANALGFGMALLSYAFLTGNGSLHNSFLCVLLFTQSCSALVKQRGLIITAANRLLRLLGCSTIDKDLVNRLVGGNTLGNLASVAWAGAVGNGMPMAWVGGALIICAAVFLLTRRLKLQKEVAV